VTLFTLTEDGVPNDWVSLSSPTPGRNFTVLVEDVGSQVREAIEQVLQASESGRSAYSLVFGPRLGHLGFQPSADQEPVLAARAVVAMWLSGYGLGAVANGEPYSVAEEWFTDAAASLPQLSPPSERPVFRALPSPPIILALLPYILDPLAPGTRRSVMRQPSEEGDRRRRKASGVYYTPGDVAAFMIREASASSPQHCLDPASGTGVFLRAALLLQAVPNSALFGIDIDPFAADAVAFVLATAALSRSSRWRLPWSAWHAARMRAATLDSLLVVPGIELDSRRQAERESEFRTVEEMLAAGEKPSVAEDQAPLTALGSLFPPLRNGVDLIVSNPPYTRLGIRPPLDPITSRYSCLGASGAAAGTRAEALFVELASQLVSTEGALSLVLPLSVATSSRREFVALRRAMQVDGGAWTFSFFDRAPDALFGDDVKTRNAIVSCKRSGPPSLHTTRLQRWTSWTRARLFASIETCQIDFDIAHFIPKLGDSSEVRLLERLLATRTTLGDAAVELTKLRLEPRLDMTLPAVFVAPTAYSWLGCAREANAFARHGHTSESELSAMYFPDDDLADASLAVVASRLTWWLWRVEGDGFHVTQAFLRRLPFPIHAVDASSLSLLAEVGRRLWRAMSVEPVASVNRGRRTVAFCPLTAGELLDAADECVIQTFQLADVVSASSVRTWHENAVVVDFERRAPGPLLKKEQTRAA
jgi:hypothetical protein